MHDIQAPESYINDFAGHGCWSKARKNSLSADALYEQLRKGKGISADLWDSMLKPCKMLIHG